MGSCAYFSADTQVLMAREGAIAPLIALLDSPSDLIQRQSAKALANLGVNSENKQRIAEEGALPRLVLLSGAPQVNVRIEAIAALANLAVNGKSTVQCNGSVPHPFVLLIVLRKLYQSATCSMREKKIILVLICLRSDPTLCKKIEHTLTIAFRFCEFYR
jgi:hypothetical protein